MGNDVERSMEDVVRIRNPREAVERLDGAKGRGPVLLGSKLAVVAVLNGYRMTATC